MINTLAWSAAGLWLLGLARILNPRSRYDWIHPVRIVAWSWAFIFFINACQLIEFPAVSWEPWLYLVAFASLQMIGAAVIAGRGRRSRRIGHKVQSSNAQMHPQIQKLTRIIVILGFFAVLLDLYGARNFSPSAVGQLRDVMYQATSRLQASWFQRITQFTSPLTWMGLILTLVFAEKLSPWYRRLGVLIAIGIVLLGVASGGRTIILKLGLVVLAAIWVRRSMGLRAWPWRWTISIRLLATLATGAAVFYFVYVFVWRAGGLENVYISVPVFDPYAQESAILLWFLQAAPDYVRNLIEYSLLSIGTLADNFASFYTLVHISPMWGLWEVGLTNLFQRLGLLAENSIDQMANVTRAYASVGLFDGNFRTMAQQFILDFGRGGAIMASVVYGAVLGFFYHKFNRRRSFWAPIYVLLLVWAIYGAVTSPIDLPQILLAMYLIAYGLAFNLADAKVSGAGDLDGYPE